jgi:hypothetical protein
MTAGLLQRDIVVRAVYSRRQLLSLRCAPDSKSMVFVNEVVTLGLLCYRGKRAGLLTRSRRARVSVYKHDLDCQPGRLSTVPGYRLCRPLPTTHHPCVLVDVNRAVNVGVLNARSLGNKSAAVLDIVVDNSLDLFAVVETWHDSYESPSVISSTPSGYRVFERARPRCKSRAVNLKTNHGGICVFVRPDLHASIVDFPLYKSFELLPLFVHIGTLSFVLVVVYRPDPVSAVTDDFLVDFADTLERTSSFAGCVIVGDINVHIDDATSAHTTRFFSLLDSFGLRLSADAR